MYRMKKEEGQGYRPPRAKTAEEALAALMRYASRAERSSGDALRLMCRWGVPEGDRPGVLERLERMKFIDDERFAAAYVREKHELAGWGVYKITAGLCAKGIAGEIIERAVADLRGGVDEGRLRELLTRKLRGLHGGTRYELKGKLLRYGASRGFAYESVLSVVDDLLASIPGEEE